MLKCVVSSATPLLFILSILSSFSSLCSEPQSIDLYMVEESLGTLSEPIRDFLIETVDTKEALVGALCLYRMHREFKATLYRALVKGVKELGLLANRITPLESINLVHDYILSQRLHYIFESSKNSCYLRWFNLFHRQILRNHEQVLVYKKWHVELGKTLFQSLEDIVDYLDQHFVNVDRAIFEKWNYPESLAREDLQSIKEENGLKACLDQLTHQDSIKSDIFACSLM